MKIPLAEVEAVRAALAPLDTDERRDRYRTGKFPRSTSVRDLDVRYRWDLYWAAGGYNLLPTSAHYLAAHIDTMLRRIVPPLTAAGESSPAVSR
jgi:hypothetical protein